MRWFWIDRFVSFERGRRAVATKNFSLAEDYLTDYMPGMPIFPQSLVVEGIAQTGGLLVAEYGGFRERVVLAKLSRATFHFLAAPGDTLTYDATIVDLKSDGAICRGESRRGPELQAEVELMFAYLDARFEGVDLFEPATFLGMLRLLGVYSVGRKEDGSPLDVPVHLLDAAT
jgi:3-hydroxyacyl-[acyl-carrier-protein] dehydratase